MNFRVANIIEEGRLGGPQVYICAVEAVLKGQVETLVIMPKENSVAFRERCDAIGVPYITLPITRVTKEWRVAVRYMLFSFFEVLRLVRILKKGKFDLVYANGGSWQFKAVLAAKLAGQKVLWHLNDTSMPGVILRLFSVVSRLADGFIFASERSRAYYGPLMHPGKPEFVIPSPVDTDKFDPAREYAGDEELIANWSGKLVIGTVVNVNPVKGLEVFIRAAAEIKKRFDNACFVVVGPIFKCQQRYFERLQRLCEELGVKNIEFVGGRSDVKPLLKRFDIYVCSSRAESSPIAVWEAMAMGKPVVSTDVGDVPLYVQDGDKGFIVAEGDSDGMAEKIAQLAADEDMRHEFGKRARETAVRELNPKRCADRHLAAYTAILKQ